MRRLAMCLTLISAMTLPALAALPPHYQRRAEFAAVLTVATETLGIGRVIEAIEISAPDVFSVRAGACTLTVRIVDSPNKHGPGWAGPREFTAVADPMDC